MAKRGSGERSLSESVAGRAEAQQLARSDPKRAFDVARRIADPWYAAQALSTIARHAPKSLSTVALTAARTSARAGKDTFQQAAVLAWPLRAAIELGEDKIAADILADARLLLPQIDNFSSRAEAFGLVFQAAFPGGAEFWTPLLASLAELCPPTSHWRAARLHRLIVWILTDAHANLALGVAEALPEGRTRRQCARDLANGVKCAPRPFF